VIVLAVWAILKWTRFGRNLYAVGGNSESALMLGINVKRTRFFSYILCGLFAGIAGYVYLLHTGAGNAANASQAEIQAIASSIIGGTLLTGGVGSVIGTLFEVMSLKTINNIVIASGLREPYWQSITTGLMLSFFILFQSVILALRKKSGASYGKKLRMILQRNSESLKIRQKSKTIFITTRFSLSAMVIYWVCHFLFTLL
jgi:simple sugar transport system permease protein